MPTRSVDSSAGRSYERPSAVLPLESPVFSTPAVRAPQVIGIWHLGQPIHSGNQSVLYTAQPADAIGSPRFDYVLRTLPSAQEPVVRNQAVENNSFDSWLQPPQCVILI